jgi:hypothetical protein
MSPIHQPVPNTGTGSYTCPMGTSSIINIPGIAIGTARSLLIVQYVVFELSYNHFHKIMILFLIN